MKDTRAHAAALLGLATPPQLALVGPGRENHCDNEMMTMCELGVRKGDSFRVSGEEDSSQQACKHAHLPCKRRRKTAPADEIIVLSSDDEGGGAANSSVMFDEDAKLARRLQAEEAAAPQNAGSIADDAALAHRLQIEDTQQLIQHPHHAPAILPDHIPLSIDLSQIEILREGPLPVVLFRGAGGDALEREAALLKYGAPKREVNTQTMFISLSFAHFSLQTAGKDPRGN